MIVHEDTSGIFVPFWILYETPSTTAAVLLAQITWLFQPSLRGLDRARFTEKKGERWLAMSDHEMAEELGMSDDTIFRARAALKKTGLVLTMNGQVEGVRRCLVRPNPEILARRFDTADPRYGSDDTAITRRADTAKSRRLRHRDNATSFPSLETDEKTEESSPPASGKTAVDRGAHRLAVLAFEQTVKPTIGGGKDKAFLAVLGLFKNALVAGRSYNELERAVTAGIDVWTTQGLNTTLAKLNNGNRPRSPIADHYDIEFDEKGTLK